MDLSKIVAPITAPIDPDALKCLDSSGISLKGKLLVAKCATTTCEPCRAHLLRLHCTTTSSPLKNICISVVYNFAFPIQFLDLRRRVRLLLCHNHLFATMCALAQDVGYFRPIQVAKSRGFLGSLRQLRKANQGGALRAGHLFVEHDSASFHGYKRRSSVFAVQAFCEFRNDNRRWE